MSQLRSARAALAAAALALPLLSLSAPFAYAALPPYSLVGSYALPTGAPGDFNPVQVDVMPDGRLIGIASDGRILVQTALNTSAYTHAGTVDPAIFAGDFGNFGASFAAVSPDGSRLAIGDNGAFNRVHFLSLAALDPLSPTPTTSAAAPNFDGAWASGSSMFVSGFGASAGVWRIDADGLSATEVITNPVGGAGGIAIRGGHIFTGDGFNTSDSGAPTGNVRAFDLATLSIAPSSVAFDTGTLIADALSASPVRFDALGNMLLGGGDFFAGSNDFGYAAVVDTDAILAALTGSPLAPDAAELRLSPAGASAYYGIEFNDSTGEALVFADGIAYRYAVPAPGASALLALSGIVVTRRRRR